MGIIVKCVKIKILPGKTGAFISATLENALNTRQESGNLRFDINQSENDPEIFFLFEAYRDEKAIQHHKSTGHYKTWCDTAEPMMATSRETTSCRVIFSDQLTE